MAGIGGENRQRKETCKSTAFQIRRFKKVRPKKRRKEMVEQDMTARRRQRMDAQNRTQKKLRCKNRLTHTKSKAYLVS